MVAQVGDDPMMKRLHLQQARLERSSAVSAVPLACVLLLAIAGAACSAPEPAPPLATSARTAGPGVRSASAELTDKIGAEIGDAACDTAQQCRTLAYGHKACGGPERYVAYSTKRSDTARLAALAASYASARGEQDARAGVVSTCSIVTDPGATCSAGRCTLLQQGAGSPAAR